MLSLKSILLSDLVGALIVAPLRFLNCYTTYCMLSLKSILLSDLVGALIVAPLRFLNWGPTTERYSRFTALSVNE